MRVERLEARLALAALRPAAPVAQNTHERAQPACAETHRVRRNPSGMSTLSTASPSSRRNKTFSVPSEEIPPCSAAGEEIRHVVINS